MGTGFAQDTNACRITPAAGPILTGHESQLTGNPRITGHPFAQSKKKGQTVGATSTRINIPFIVDQQSPGVPIPVYNIRSVNKDVTIEWDGGFPSDTVTVTADQQDFQLVEFSGNEPVCSGSFKLPLQITFKRFEISRSP